MTVSSRAKCLTVTLMLLSRPCLATDVASCGQKIGPGDTGVVAADIDCSAADGIFAAVLLGDNATLMLNGHTITGRTSASLPRVVGVAGDAARRITIVGPGVIAGSSTGITGGMTRVTVSGVTLRDNEYSIDVALGKLLVSNVDSTSTVSGISARAIRADHVTVTTNYAGNCIFGKQISGSDVTVSGCHGGVDMLGSVRLTRLDARNNLTIGVAGEHVTLVDSIVTGNIFIGQPLDILTATPPRLVSTQCGTSARVENHVIGPTWGVCAND